MSRSDGLRFALVLGALLAGCRDYFVVGTAPSEPVDGGGALDAGAGIAADGGARDGSAVEAGAGSFCAREPAVFCEDFDDGAALGARWDSAPKRGALIDTSFASPPRAFEMRWPDQGASGADYLAKTFTIPGEKSLRLEVAFRPTDNEPVYPIGLFFDGDRRLVLNLDGFVNEAIGGSQNGGYKYNRPSANETFRRYVISVDRASNTVEMSIDGNVVVAKTKLANANLLGAGPIRLVVGLYYAPAETPWTGAFDDIRVTTF